jgi:hypothetical protein
MSTELETGWTPESIRTQWKRESLAPVGNRTPIPRPVNRYTDMTAPVRCLVVSFPQRRLGFDHVGFMVDKVALGQVFSEYFGFPGMIDGAPLVVAP